MAAGDPEKVIIITQFVHESLNVKEHAICHLGLRGGGEDYPLYYIVAFHLHPWICHCI